MDKTLKEKLGIVEIADVEALFDALTPWEKLEFINNHTDLENVSDVTIADYVLEHKQVLKLIFARIVKEDRIK